MSEFYETESGVEMIPETNLDVPAAGEQQLNLEITPQNTDTGVENEPADAGQVESIVEQFDERTETAFAKRLASEREKIQQEVYRQAQAEFYQQVEPLLELAEFEAQRHGVDPITWARNIQANREQSYQQQLLLAAEEYGIDPQMVNQLINNHPSIIQARQMEQQIRQRETEFQERERLQQEANELSQAFPDIDSAAITPEVLELRKKTGISLLDAYLRTNYKNMITGAKLTAEQAAVKALQNNAQTSPGALGSEGAQQQTGYSALSKAERKALRERVLKGEQVII